MTKHPISRSFSGETGFFVCVFEPSLSLLRKATSPEGRGLGLTMQSVWIAKGSPFGGAGIERSEMTERVPP